MDYEKGLSPAIYHLKQRTAQLLSDLLSIDLDIIEMELDKQGLNKLLDDPEGDTLNEDQKQALKDLGELFKISTGG